MFQDLAVIAVNELGEATGYSLVNRNVGKSTLYGVEAESVLRFDHGFMLNLNALWLDSEIKKGKVDFRVDKAGVVHAVMGKCSFGGEKLSENILAFVDKLIQLKPSTSKGIYLRAISVSSTMGPGFRVDPVQMRTLIKAA